MSDISKVIDKVERLRTLCQCADMNLDAEFDGIIKTLKDADMKKIE